jgi:exosome complex RNA-binding protein Csl4
MRPFKRDMKIATCSKCGKDLGVLVPKDAEQIICFACDNKKEKRK